MGTILNGLVAIVFVVLFGKLLVWIITGFPDWARVGRSLPGRRPKTAAKYRELSASTHSAEVDPAGHHVREPTEPLGVDSFIVRKRALALLWTILVGSVSVSVVSVGIALAHPVSGQTGDPAAPAFLAYFVICIGAALSVAGLLLVLSLWRWQVVVDRFGLEVRVGLAKPHALTFDDVSQVRFVRQWLNRPPTVIMLDRYGKTIAKVSGICDGYSSFCDRLRLERPDFFSHKDT